MTRMVYKKNRIIIAMNKPLFHNIWYSNKLYTKNCRYLFISFQFKTMIIHFIIVVAVTSIIEDGCF